MIMPEITHKILLNNKRWFIKKLIMSYLEYCKHCKTINRHERNCYTSHKQGPPPLKKWSQWPSDVILLDTRLRILWCSSFLEIFLNITSMHIVQQWISQTFMDIIQKINLQFCNIHNNTLMFSHLTMVVLFFIYICQ